jgi:hypothetical protein
VLADFHAILPRTGCGGNLGLSAGSSYAHAKIESRLSGYLYLKLGKRLKATIRQLGYPTKNRLTDVCAFDDIAEVQTNRFGAAK